MSFRLKTIFGVALIEVTLLVVLVWNSMDLMRRSGEEQLIQRAETTSRLFASMVKDAVLSYDLATLETFVSELMKNKGLVYVRVYDQDQLLASGGDSTQLARPFEPDHSLGSATDAVFDIDADIIESEQLYGRVEVGLNTKQLEQKLEAATWKASSLAMVEIVLSALFSFLLGSWLVRQLELLRHASSEIANGQLGMQIPVKGSDEIAETAQHFNQMSLALQHSTDELNRLNASLEGQVIKRTQQLKYANESLQSILQSMSEILLVVDERGDIQMTNPASSRLLGYDEELLLHQNIDMLINEEHDQQRLNQLIEQQIQTGEEFLLLTKTGERLPVLMMASRIQDNNQQGSFTVITAQDLRELKRAEEGERFLSFQEGLNEMSANVLHNIGNNLTGIRGGVLKIEQQSGHLKKISALLGRFSSDVMQEIEEIRQGEHASVIGPALQKVPLVLEKSGHSIDTIISSEVNVAIGDINNLAGHIQSVIRATPLTAGDSKRSKDFELDNLLKDVETLLGQALQEKNIEVEHQISHSVGHLMLSRNLLLQAIDHLMSNSIDALKAGQQGKIVIRADQEQRKTDENWLIIQVIDNGTGIDKETLPKVAKSGFTTKEKGGGNGLHAVGNYINAIHGEFDVKNRSDGSGVVVTLAIPLK
ncbi:MAG: PAS domain S-box protein [Gammaproteobacteria bacterium]|jgi:PAS domain S-box-containing protein|nr:PAS domain S-box protein [Gammaproteobacteria bacterium]MBT4605924.1 PAS domain S-box protein [Thiotrichales bacterium]MBT3472684.1 PAS domain S-box protein [Gammaproteobacteria bacterium]MBT3968494.1 PAS domain S-box protein [Gammaproteobacteria bacterium]MBT4081516.1 PAS domain S-box protein [Gammaproteobacteria bacterium]